MRLINAVIVPVVHVGVVMLVVSTKAKHCRKIHDHFPYIFRSPVCFECFPRVVCETLTTRMRNEILRRAAAISCCVQSGMESKYRKCTHTNKKGRRKNVKQERRKKDKKERKSSRFQVDAPLHRYKWIESIACFCRVAARVSGYTVREYTIEGRR